MLDASRNFSKTERAAAKRMADKAGVPLITIYLDTPEEIVRQRLLENRIHPSRRDVTDRDFEDVIRAMDPPAAAENPLIFHFTDDMDGWLAAHSPVFA